MILDKPTMRRLIRERDFYRDLLEQVASDKRRTRARRLVESGLAFWDALQRARKKNQNL